MITCRGEELAETTKDSMKEVAFVSPLIALHIYIYYMLLHIITVEYQVTVSEVQET